MIAFSGCTYYTPESTRRGRMNYETNGGIMRRKRDANNGEGLRERFQ